MHPINTASVKCNFNYQPLPGFYVKVTDSCNMLIHEGITDLDGTSRFHIPYHDKYQIEVISWYKCLPRQFSPARYVKWVTLCPDHSPSMYFSFYYIQYNGCLITATLTDWHYPSLLIEKGDILL